MLEHLAYAGWWFRELLAIALWWVFVGQEEVARKLYKRNEEQLEWCKRGEHHDREETGSNGTMH